MHAAEVVVREVKRQGRAQVLPLLAERIGQACEALAPLAKRSVLAFDMACANAFHVGIAIYRFLYRVYYKVPSFEEELPELESAVVTDKRATTTKGLFGPDLFRTFVRTGHASAERTLRTFDPRSLLTEQIETAKVLLQELAIATPQNTATGAAKLKQMPADVTLHKPIGIATTAQVRTMHNLEMVGQ